MDIFKKINLILNESKDKIKESDIPIHPEMETKEQGEMAAAEKVLKLFQKLSLGSDSKEEIKDSKPEIPDDMIDPMLKEPPKSSKDKTFEKNKLAGWDEKSDEKIKKEIDSDNSKDEDDEFDDFDYRKNPFGDEDNDDEMPESKDEKTEDEKLKDTIDDAIDSLSGNNDEQEGQNDENGDDSGANWGDDESGEDGKDKKEGSKSDQSNQNGKQNDSNENENSSQTSGSGKRETKSEKQKRLEDLKKSLESENMEEFSDKIDEIKNATDVSKDAETPGGQIETPSDEDFKNEMKNAGFDDKTIDEMTKKKNINGNDDYSKEEMEELKKQVVDGLEKSCEKKGGSALASTIVKNSLSKKINNEEWKEMMKVFLKAKSISVGNMSKSNKGIKWGNKNHLWRDAVLPTSGPSKGTIQNIYCFVDFSGSVDQDLVFTFLGKVINMCVELKYTQVKVYGFGERLTEPKIINDKFLKKGIDLALSQTWDFISSQNPGMATENFSVVAEEINAIKRKEKDAVFLIFGDGQWHDYMVGPKSLKYDIMNSKYLNDICILAYYFYDGDIDFIGVMNILKQIVGIKHIITTKASSIHK